MAQYIKKPIPVEAVLFEEGMQDGIGDPSGENGNIPISPLWKTRNTLETLERITL